MLKIFTTQVTGLMNRVYEKQAYQLEDGARLLAQAAIGEGTIFLYGEGEMAGVISEAINGLEPLPSAKHLEHLSEVTHADRVLIFSRFSNDRKAVDIAKHFEAEGVPTVAVSAIVQEEGETLQHFVDVHIDTNLKKPLVPMDDGERTGFPALLSSLYIYHCLALTLHEMLSEY
ncbi:DUF2529 domain-containing protein [Bacillus sp. FJAT-47783]|uniref:DUF2529 domain-containing protein n=1 Tax=Bacillus sp. FJAT-47783 TaxID=2922712 RepID=UPI001FAC1906|nr:DUF2529 domain-containing protein [Bacillus sp. FJAT-47783]